SPGVMKSGIAQSSLLLRSSRLQNVQRSATLIQSPASRSRLLASPRRTSGSRLLAHRRRELGAVLGRQFAGPLADLLYVVVDRGPGLGCLGSPVAPEPRVSEWGVWGVLQDAWHGRAFRAREWVRGSLGHTGLPSGTASAGPDASSG